MNAFLPHVAEKAILRLYEDLSTPRSLTASILYRYGEWDQLALLEANPLDYLDSESYWKDSLSSNVLRKLEDLPTSFDRKAKSEELFLQCERENLRTNRRLYPLLHSCFHDEVNVGVLDFVDRARKIVGDILGPCPDVFDGRFGPGATFGDKGRKTLVPDKMSSEPTFTDEAWPFLFPWSGTLWASACASSSRLPKKVRGNRFSSVPKDCTKNRGIAIEPSINVFYQLAYGKLIRSRLRRYGIDLNEGQEKHRALARCSSTAGDLATLDLSNASDTISRNLVKLLLPHKWFDVLDDLRSKRTLFKGGFHLLEKFSSMGNGFTFELETVIFLSLILAVRNGLQAGVNVFAFGDDLILPVDVSKVVMPMLKFFGLTVNPRKSFDSGYFRESCGGDFFDGVPVRSHYLKSSPNEPQELISFANGLRRTADYAGRFHIVYRAWRCILDGLPVSIRNCRGPQDLGDLVIHDEEFSWLSRQRHCIRYIRVYRPAKYRKVSWKNFRPDVILASATYGCDSGASNWGPFRREGIIPRDGVIGYKLGWVAYS